jgi:hypothetical protein
MRVIAGFPHSTRNSTLGGNQASDVTLGRLALSWLKELSGCVRSRSESKVAFRELFTRFPPMTFSQLSPKALLSHADVVELVDTQDLKS